MNEKKMTFGCLCVLMILCGRQSEELEIKNKKINVKINVINFNVIKKGIFKNSWKVRNPD